MGQCECGTEKPTVARNMCKKCYDRWYYTNNKGVATKGGARKKPTKDLSKYPVAHQVTIYECSDGREFSSEIEALRYELELFRKG